MLIELFYPQRPYSLIAAINRVSLATGGLSNAIAAAGADYNGHRVHVDFTTHRSWAATYTWGGLRWLASRTTFDLALAAAEREYNRGALGAETVVACETAEQVEVCLARGYLHKDAAEEQRATWKDARYDEVNQALELQRRFGIPAPAFLAKAPTVGEYRQALEEYRAARRRAR